MTEQPARVSYFFGQGYRDLVNTIKEAWTRNFSTAKENFHDASENGFISILGGINLVTAISIFVFGSIITAITTFIHVGVLAVFFTMIYIGFGLLWTIDRIYIFANKIKNVCSNPDCQASFLIPVYECPVCGRLHTQLVPSKYGILKRTCLCGNKLPTTFLNGRGNLVAYCPVCEHPLSGDTGSRQYAFPMIGGPSVGKTCYINMTIDQLINNIAPSNGWQLNFLTDSDAREHAQAMRSLKAGIRLLKTESSTLTAYQMMLSLPSKKIKRRIYIYDISGEIFSSSQDVSKNQAFTYADGFIFIFDPLSLDQFRMEVEDIVDADAYGASSKNPDDTLDIMLVNVQKMFNLSDKDMLNRNLAVVINKVDVLISEDKTTLNDKIGAVAAHKYLADNSDTCKTFEEACDQVCRNFLMDYGAGNFIRTAERKFKKVRYFTCSALGHNIQGRPYKAENVTEPLMWLLQKVDSDIKLAH